MHKAYINWSGGKDSALALYYTLQSQQYNISTLLTNVNSFHNRISMHGVRRQLLTVQAAAIGLPLQTIELPEQPSMDIYELAVKEKTDSLKANGYTHAIFGDIFLEDLKLYREEKLKQLGIDAVFPLWKKNTKKLMTEFIQSGFKAIIVCVNEMYLNKSFCGRLIDEKFLADLPPTVDICGENGEYHSFVFDGPIFKNPVPYKKGDMVQRSYPAPKTSAESKTVETYFSFCDLLPLF